MDSECIRGYVRDLTEGGCQGLFIDIADQIYCSNQYAHAVMKKYANDPSTIPVIVAGNGTGGSDVHQLNNPVWDFCRYSIESLCCRFW